MKKVIYVMLVSSLTVFGINNSFAQDKKDPAKRVEQRVKKMDEALNLSTEQETKLKDLFTKQMTERKANHEKAKQERKQQRESFSSELKNILSADQFSKLQAMRSERMKQQNPQERIEKKLVMYKQELNLSDKQAEDVKAALEKHAATVSKIRGEGGNEEASKEKMKVARENLQKDLKSILSKEQLTKLKSLKKQHKGNSKKK